MTAKNTEPLKEQVDSALLTCMADVPSDEVPKWEAAGTQKLKELAEVHGPDEVIRCVTQEDHDYSFELYFLARAGITEVIPHLEELLQSDNGDALTSAVCGLLALDVESGWKTLEAMQEGKHAELLEDALYWYFFEELQRIGTKKALKILGQLKKDH